MKYQATIGETTLDFTLEKTAIGYKIFLNNKFLDVDCEQLTPHSFSLLLNNKSHYLTVTENGDGFEVTIDQHTNIVIIKDETSILMEKFGFSDSNQEHAGEIRAQIPGLVTQIFIKVGDVVEKNQKLLILEAMKMENEIDSPVSGKVIKIHVHPGETVNKNNLIMEIDE
jgi:biotin carboxyl carrier protein